MVVGRTTERAMFARTLEEARQGALRVVFVHGAAGIGKTTLLDLFEDDARTAGLEVTYVHGLKRPETVGAGPLVVAALAASGPGVVILDELDELRAYEAVLCGAVAELRDPRVVVVASRTPPSVRWRAAPAFHDGLRVIELGELSADECHAYLAERGVPEAKRGPIAAFSNGHPLALVLASSVERGDGPVFGGAVQRDVIRSLYDFFFAQIEDRRLREAVEVCAVVRALNEDTLAALVPSCDAAHAFAFLRRLGFVRESEDGLVMHELARQVAIDDLRWRSPCRWVELLRQAVTFFSSALDRGSDAWLPAFAQMSFLLRWLPLPNTLHLPAALDVAIARRADVHLAEVAALAESMEGADSARAVRYWFAQQPQALIVLEDMGGRVAGFVLTLDLGRTTAAQREEDPIVTRVHEWAESRLAGRRGLVAFTRVWMSAADHHRFGALHSLCGMLKLEPFFRARGAAFLLAPYREDVIADTAVGRAIAGFDLVPELAFETAGGRHEMAVHDLRGVSVPTWISGVVKRTLAFVHGATPNEPSNPRTVRVALDRKAFADAVQADLRALRDPTRLSRSLLVDAGFVLVAAGPDATREQRVVALAESYRAAIDRLRVAADCGEPIARVVAAAFLSGAESHERAAESLRVSYATFRRYLARGVAALVEDLWVADGGATRPTTPPA